jgi:hypothetical protein
LAFVSSFGGRFRFSSVEGSPLWRAIEEDI